MILFFSIVLFVFFLDVNSEHFGIPKRREEKGRFYMRTNSISSQQWLLMVWPVLFGHWENKLSHLYDWFWFTSRRKRPSHIVLNLRDRYLDSRPTTSSSWWPIYYYLGSLDLDIPSLLLGLSFTNNDLL